MYYSCTARVLLVSTVKAAPGWCRHKVSSVAQDVVFFVSSLFFGGLNPQNVPGKETNVF